jgi:PAS domain S-box-containing protein
VISSADILKASILIVDDQDANVSLLEQMLSGAGYVSVTSTKDPNAVCELHRQNHYSLILLDLQMPGLDGFQVMEALKTIETGGYLPVLVQTSQPNHRLRALKAGAKDFVSKPFDLAEILLRAHNMIEVRLLHQEAARRTEKAELQSETIKASFKEIGDLKFALDEHAIVAVTDPQGKITYVNEKFCAISKYSREELLGQDHRIVNSGFHPKEFIRELWTTISAGKVWKGEIKNQAKDGSFYWVDNTIVPFLDEQGKPRQYVSIRADITERKRAEEQLQVSFKEVGDLNTEIQNFYHTLSHELKTPLTSAREFVSIVMDGLAGSLNKTQLEYLGIAKESCDQLRFYINDMLDVTRLQTGKMSIEFLALPLAPLLERIVEMLTPAAVGKGLSLSCDCQPDLPEVPIDKQRILQVLTNLTTNAIKFTPTGGRIYLSLNQAPGDSKCLQISVRDTGGGIPKDQLDLIFDRLYQANRNGEPVESRSGLGLGLFICQELVALHGGRIWVESEIGKGSTFSFVIPKQTTKKTAHVLIVDDDHQIREMLRLILEDDNYEVTTVAGGSEALQRMDQKTPDVVVLDLMMTGLDGVDTLKEIRMKWGFIPVIVHTGYPNSHLMETAMESSPFTLLAKPCPPHRFVETVRRMCRTHETQFLKKNIKMAGYRQDGVREIISPAKISDTTNSIHEKNTDHRR